MHKIINRLVLGILVFAFTFGIAHGVDQKQKIELKIKIYKGFKETNILKNKVVLVLWSAPEKNVLMKKDTKPGCQLNPKLVGIQNESNNIVIRELAECSWIFGKLDPGFEQHFAIYLKDDVEYYIRLTVRDGKIKLAVSPAVYTCENASKMVYRHLMPMKLVIEDVEMNNVIGFLNGDNEMIYMTFSQSEAPLDSNNLHNADFTLMSYERLDYPKYLKSKLLDVEIVHGEIDYGLFDDVEFVKVDGRQKEFLKTLEKKLKSICINRLIGLPKKYYLQTKIIFIKGKSDE